jgi:hypothetical protein
MGNALLTVNICLKNKFFRQEKKSRELFTPIIFHEYNAMTLIKN